MPKTKAQKQEILDELKQGLEKTKSIVFVDIQGLKAKELVLLRRKIKQAKGQLKVAKKTLIDLAIQGKKESKDFSAKKTQGEIAVLFATEDAINPLKAAYSFSKGNEKLRLLAGIFDNILIKGEELLAIAQLPSRQELLARLARSVASPLSGFVNVLQGNIKGLVLVLNAISDKSK